MRPVARRVRPATWVGCAALCLALALPATMLLGAGGPPEPVVRGQDIVLEAGLVTAGFDRVVTLGLAAEMVGFTWLGKGHSTIEVRGKLPAGGWTEWVSLEGSKDHGPDEGSAEGTGRAHVDPAWLGHDIRLVQVRVHEGRLRDLRLHAIDSEEPRAGAGLFAARPAAAAAARPGIITRAQWGADESWRDRGNPGCDGQPRYAPAVNFAVVHHTVSSNNYAPSDSAALIRGIYRFHTHTNRWCDVGYNFFVDRHGQIFEGRFGGVDRAVIGGHTGGFNTGSTGLAVIGDFERNPVPPAAYDGLRRLLGWKLWHHGVDPLGRTRTTAGGAASSRHPEGSQVWVQNLQGHRDTNHTACPGARLYDRLAQLRHDVASDIARARDQRLVCDWNGDGRSSPAHFSNGVWHIRYTNDAGPPNRVIGFGDPGDVAVCGDWDGNGTDTPGVFRRGAWFLTNSLQGGFHEIAFGYGNATGDVPVVGNWDGVGADGVGVFRRGAWFLTNSLQGGFHEIAFGYGNTTGDVPVVGNWDGVGADGVGVFRSGAWFLTNSLRGGVAEIAPFGFGNGADTPVPGDWDGNRTTTQGVSRGALWFHHNTLGAGAASGSFGF